MGQSTWSGLKQKLWPTRRQPKPVDVLTGYALWASSYPAQAHNPLMAVEEQAILSLLPADLTGQCCLDLACGSGRYLRYLHRHNAKQTIGLDYSPQMLRQAQNLPLPRVKLSWGSFLALPFAANTFNLITCGLAVGHEKNLAQIIAEIARVLRPGGLVIYSDVHPFVTLSGGQRTFTAATGQTFALEHHLHLPGHHLDACQAAGLRMTSMLESLAGPGAPPEFAAMPVVLVIRAEKM
jgi:malonyl-CoA O-methyltransferase